MRARLTAIWVIARRELVTKATSKAFRISTVLLLIGLVLGIVIPAATMRGTSRYTIALAEASPGLGQAIGARARAAGITVAPRPAPSRAAAVAMVKNGAASAAVIGTRELVWKSSEDTRLAGVLISALTGYVIGQRAAALGLSHAQLGGLLAPVTPVVTRLRAPADQAPRTAIAMIGMIALFIALNFYGSYVLSGVVEEKSSRVVEVLLARVRPTDLLVGKVAGIGALGIGQFAGLAAVAVITLRIARLPGLPGGASLLIAGVVAWFLLGYCFYSVLYGALGALASRMEDAQAAVAPLTVFLVLAYLGAFGAVAAPRAWWVTAASLFPPTAPLFMPLRVALATVPAWQFAAAIVLMLAGIAVLARAGGRIYRGAVLHAGARLGIRQAWHLAAPARVSRPHPQRPRPAPRCRRQPPEGFGDG